MLVPATCRLVSMVVRRYRDSRMPLASPASGSSGRPRTSSASAPPTGPPMVPETKTQGPALTALGMRSGAAGPGSQMLFLGMGSPNDALRSRLPESGVDDRPAPLVALDHPAVVTGPPVDVDVPLLHH